MISQVARKVKRWLRERGLRVSELAYFAHLTPTTVANLLSGVSKSLKSRQSLTDVIGFSIWNGVTPSPPMVFLENETPAIALAMETAKNFSTGIPFVVLRDRRDLREGRAPVARGLLWLTDHPAELRRAAYRHSEENTPQPANGNTSE